MEMVSWPLMVEVPAAKVPVPVAFVKLRLVMVPVAKVEFTEMTGVPVVAERKILEPAVREATYDVEDDRKSDGFFPWKVPSQFPVEVER